MMTNKEIAYKLAAEQLRTSKPLFVKDGALAPMLERILKPLLRMRWMLTYLKNPVRAVIAAIVRCPRPFRLSMAR